MPGDCGHGCSARGLDSDDRRTVLLDLIGKLLLIGQEHLRIQASGTTFGEFFRRLAAYTTILWTPPGDAETPSASLIARSPRSFKRVRVTCTSWYASTVTNRYASERSGFQW